ncbi:MAG TPA: hypothetical protein VFI65_09730 [Streptosporangiaceae bacterium]|nr:hypothetical protein [Streptosporangiaceae bacterium]
MNSVSLGTFEILRIGERISAERVAGQLKTTLAQPLGFTWSDIFVSSEPAAVVHCAEWPAESAAGLPPMASQSADLARELVAQADGGSVRTLTGTLAVSIDGAAAAQAPGVAVLAIRHVSGVDAANELGQLLLRSGEWKRGVAGFIGASAYISANGREFINYVRWVDEEAYRVYMDDPRNAAGQPNIASVESAKPEFVRGRCTSHSSAL